MDAISTNIHNARQNRINGILGCFSPSDFDDEETLRKSADDEEDEIEKEEDFEPSDESESDEPEDEDGVKKSDIVNAFGENITSKKTGKEIKDQITSIILPPLTAKLEEEKAKANSLLEECGSAPTKKPDCWWTYGLNLDCGYNIYDWMETCYHCAEDSPRIVTTLSAADEADKKGNMPKDAEQAKIRNDYNETVRKICQIIVDITACNAMLKNLNDSTNYDLTVKQILVLKF